MVTNIDGAFAALAEPTRRKIIDLLCDRPLRTGEIAGALGMSGPATSRHLRVLRQGGLVEGTNIEDDARVRVYQLRPESFTILRRWLDHVDAYWNDQLVAFRDHAEASPNAPAASDRDRSSGSGKERPT